VVSLPVTKKNNMLDEMTNADFLCTLTDAAHPFEQPSAEHADLMVEAARRIRKLENQVKAWEKAAWDSASVETPDELKHFIYSIENS
jgi:hypothetical protein